MPTSVRAVLIIVIGLAAVSARAQLLPTWEAHITLTQQDLDLIRKTVTGQVHGKPAGTVATWSNPASGNSGTIWLVKTLVLNNQKCEEISYEVRSGGTPSYSEHYNLTSCLQPDGTWKIA